MLIAINQEVLNKLLKQIEKDQCSVLDPHFVIEILDAIKHPAVKSLDRGLKILPPSIAREITSYIKHGEFKNSPEWSRKLSAHKYAENLFNKALEQKNTEGCYSCLKQISSLLKDQGWVSYLEDPNIHLSDKAKILKLTGDNKIALTLVYKLLYEHKASLIPDILEEYHKILTASSIVMRAEVTTAVPIDNKYGEKIAKYLDKIFSKKVFPIFLTDPKILGGIVIRVGDKVLDHSIRNKLALLANEMREA